ncbi:MAG: replicative DNA helicase [Candidatus Omnitrophica bacterium]|nr:replicative DNA helicase [Candidatus Omnitrophota bacterium]
MDLPDVTTLERLPPQNLEAEQAVLGAMLLEEDAVIQAAELLEEAAFYKDSHRKIFAALLALYKAHVAVDLVTLTDELKKRGLLDEVGGPSYLATLTSVVPTAANAEHYCRIVKQKHILRDLIRAATHITSECYEGAVEPDHLLDRAETLIFDIASKKVKRDAVAMKDIIKSSIEMIDALYQRKGMITGLPTGFLELDQQLAGLQPADLVVVAGRPAMGKSSLALCIAEHVALGQKAGVAMFSLEMSKEGLVQRMLCSHARINAHHVRTGMLSTSDWPNLTKAAGKLSEAPIYVDDSPSMSVLELRAKARRLKSRHDISLVILDYLQLMEESSRAENRQQEISVISRSLKALARELNVPIIAVSQLSRAPERRESFRPRLSDLRECVTGDTLVTLADGRRVPVARLVGQTPDVLAVTSEGRMVHAQADKVWSVGVKPVMTVRLASGRFITVTREHRLFGPDGWVRAGVLKTGDRLAIARRLPEPRPTEAWPDLRVALLGHLIGDGSYLTHQPLRYTTASEENSDLVARAAREEFGCEVKRYAGRGNWHQLLISGNGNRWKPAGVGQWLKALGIFGQRSHEKRIPEAAFRLNHEQIALLLRHLWATDGTITPRVSGRGSHAVNFSTNSPGLAQDVAALLLRLGIVARIHRIAQGSYRPVHSVVVSGSADQARFLEQVEAFGPRAEPAARLLPVLRGTTSNTNVDTLPIEMHKEIRSRVLQSGLTRRQVAVARGIACGTVLTKTHAPSRALVREFAEVLGDAALFVAATNDLFWDRIVAVEPAGEADVYDLTVPGPSSWLADGIVSHNSGAIEQDADVVLMLFREDYYNPTEENKGIAEVIIAKQRNGPTGTVKLAFISEYTRFETLAQA